MTPRTRSPGRASKATGLCPHSGAKGACPGPRPRRAASARPRGLEAEGAVGGAADRRGRPSAGEGHLAPGMPGARSRGEDRALEGAPGRGGIGGAPGGQGRGFPSGAGRAGAERGGPRWDGRGGDPGGARARGRGHREDGSGEGGEWPGGGACRESLHPAAGARPVR